MYKHLFYARHLHTCTCAHIHTYALTCFNFPDYGMGIIPTGMKVKLREVERGSEATQLGSLMVLSAV